MRRRSVPSPVLLATLAFAMSAGVATSDAGSITDPLPPTDLPVQVSAGPPTIVRVIVGDGIIYISGRDFGATLPSVTLGGTALIVRTFNQSEIDAFVDPALPAGTYLLTVSRSTANPGAATFEVAIPRPPQSLEFRSAEGGDVLIPPKGSGWKELLHVDLSIPDGTYLIIAQANIWNQANFPLQDNTRRVAFRTYRGTDPAADLAADDGASIIGNGFLTQTFFGTTVMSPATSSTNFNRVGLACQVIDGGTDISWVSLISFRLTVMKVGPAFILSPQGIQQAESATALEHDMGLIPLPDHPDEAASPRELGAVRPNPFSGPAQIGFAVSSTGVGTIDVFDVGGRRVRHLFEGMLRAGENTVPWDGRDDSGALAPIGPYYYSVTCPSGTIRGKMMLVR
jgi:flagellar hook capping protein FlgD